ncbi:MAG: TolC family protein [Candidatus Methylomirabilales bacterium]
MKENRCIALMIAAALFLGVAAAQGEEKSGEMTVSAEKATPKPGQVMVLSLQESILLGLKNNLVIAIEGFNPKLREADVTSAKAVFDPSAFAEIGFDSREEPNRNELAEVRTSENQDLDWNFGIQQDLPTGGSYELRFDNNRNFNNAGFFAPEDPQGNKINLQTAYTPELNFVVTQPLLKNFGVDINRVQIKIAQNEQEISVDRFRQTVMDVVTQIQDVYWDLVFTLEDLKVEKRSLRLAKELAELNRARVRAGVAAPVEVTQAETDIAAREALVTAAEKRLRDQEDRLKVVLNIPKQGEWGGAVLPADPARFTPITPVLRDAVVEALRKRPDYEAAKVDISNKELTLRFARNQLLPDLSFQGSVGLNGLSASDPSYGDSLDSLTKGDSWQYSAGLVLTVPIGNRAARAEFIKAQLELQQAQVGLRDLELEITAEVREAVRRIEAGAKLVAETRAARELAAEQLRIEQKRLEAGVSTTFEVLRFQRDLSVTQSLEVRALTNYRKSIANLDRVRGVVLEKHRIKM